ncbi:hypothetical protein [Spirosoma sordidisoli]|uniref:HK97 gp10 family phage protein n=1 Tax=Spirosoma sordidisoli TaxID=2502893 RepID=A0A4Q2UGH0_9BACT|nr:hypothetical protein [Spirosoma sordidisoli]RYC66360.1 hypothetical protein EQG79_30265 [Spirosoma sordidisoli]
MYKLLTNAERVLMEELMRIRKIEIARPLILAAGALETRNAVADRIQDKGLNSAGQPMRTQAARQQGAYSARHGHDRLRRNLQIGRVDYTFTGRMMENWSVMVRTNGNVALGFRDAQEAEKAAELADYHGPAFDPTPAEIELSTDLIAKKTAELVR